MPEITAWWEQRREPGWPSDYGQEQPYWRGIISARGRCVYCGLDTSADARLLALFQTDHLVPRDEKRTDNWLNFVLACSNCNRIKRDYDPSHSKSPPRTEAERASMIADAQAEISRRIKEERTTRLNIGFYLSLLSTIEAQKMSNSRLEAPPNQLPHNTMGGG